MTIDPVYSLPSIPYLPLRFHMTAQENTRLPVFKGSLLRGTFGNALRRTVCVMTPQQECSACMLNRQCVYTKIFETLIHDQPPRFLHGLKTCPKPFILDCDEEKSQFETGDGLEFDLTLIGQACDYYPYIIFSVQRMGELGLGRRRQPFHLAEVLAQNAAGESERLYDSKTQQLQYSPPPLATDNRYSAEVVEQLEVQFLTATRLKFDNQLSMDFSFRQLLFKMLRRILELAYFHVPSAAIEWEFHPLLVAANDIHITDCRLHWLDRTRYSSRQKSEMQLGGFVGEMTLAGNLNPFLPILYASEILHVGKGTTFGLGKIAIEHG